MEAMLESAFLKVVNLSITGSYVILAVLAARLLLRRAPKKFSYALWAAVGFRLLSPVSFRAAFSLPAAMRKFWQNAAAASSRPSPLATVSAATSGTSASLWTTMM